MTQSLCRFNFPTGYTVRDIRKYLANGHHAFAKLAAFKHNEWTRIIRIRTTRHGTVLGKPMMSNRWYIVLDAQPHMY